MANSGAARRGAVGRLFDKYPETKERFPRLDCSSPDAMRASVRMQAHAGRVVSQLGALIEDLDNMAIVNETIYLLGENHNNRKVQAKDFEVSLPATRSQVATVPTRLGAALPQTSCTDSHSSEIPMGGRIWLTGNIRWVTPPHTT